MFEDDGLLEFEHRVIELDSMPEIPTKIMMNLGNPDRAFDFSGIPNRGVGLARLEFIINRMMGVHPKALLELDSLDASLQILQEAGAERVTGAAEAGRCGLQLGQ